MDVQSCIFGHPFFYLTAGIMQLFYAPGLQTEVYQFSEEESKHMIRVLRMSQGDTLQVTDGCGRWMEATILDDHPKRCTIQIHKVVENYQPRPFQLHMAVAPTKNISRFEWFLEKATEIGIDQITPLVCDHSERAVIKPERLNKVITSAVKQSLKAWHPQLNPPISFTQFLKGDLPEKRFIAYCEGDERRLLRDVYQAGDDVVILIGPEGDFSPEEVQLAMAHGFETVSLGNSRLRTETAAVVACHTTNLLND